MTAVFVGINPSSAGRSRSPTVRRTQRWAEYLGISDQIQNCVLTPGPYCANMVDLDDLNERVRQYKKLVSLGKFPSGILAKIGRPHFVMPHPSGLNRLLNDREYEISMLTKCKEYLES